MKNPRAGGAVSAIAVYGEREALQTPHLHQSKGILRYLGWQSVGAMAPSMMLRGYRPNTRLKTYQSPSLHVSGRRTEFG